MLFRILAVLILALSIFFMPFWIFVLLALVGMIYFHVFWESTILFLLSDILYGTKDATFLGAIFILAVCILIIIEIVKKKLKFYS